MSAMSQSHDVSGALGSLADFLEQKVAGFGAVGVQVTGTFVGTISFEASVNGSSWVALTLTKADGSSSGTSTTGTGIWTGSVAGLLKVRARMSAYTSGSATVTLLAVQAPPNAPVSLGSVTLNGADGKIIGDDGTTEATVLDGLTANPLVVTITDENGDPLAGTGGGPATIADGADIAEGATADAKVTGDNAGTVSAKLRGVSYLWALVVDTVNGWIKVSIQNTSIAVTGTFWQATQPVSAASLPLPSGAATSAKQDTGNSSLTSIDGKVPALGQALAAGSVPVVLPAAQISTLTPPAAITGFLTEADFDTKVGSLTETAPASDTASSGLNGRLQRIAQRLSSLITAIGSPFQAGGSIGNTSFGATQATAANLNAQVVGDVAHDAVDGGNPVKVGAKAVNAEPTAVANGDRVNFIADLAGKQIVAPYANPENLLAGKTADITGTTDTAVIAAQGAGVRIFATHILVTNSHATVGTWVNVKDGTTTIYTGYAAPVGGGFSVPLPSPLRLTANTALNVACETSGANVRASASGYKGA